MIDFVVEASLTTCAFVEEEKTAIEATQDGSYPCSGETVRV
jgi:hypothetical protein